MQWKKLKEELEWKEYSPYGYLEKKYIVLASRLIFPVFQYERTDLLEVRFLFDQVIRLDQIKATVSRDKIQVKGVDRD